MRKCSVCGHRVSRKDIYCDFCGSYIDEYDDLYIKSLYSYNIDTKLKKESTTVIFKDSLKTKENIIDYIKDLYNQYPLNSTIEYGSVYYDHEKYSLNEYIINSNNTTTLFIDKYGDFVYMRFNTYLTPPLLDDLHEQVPLIKQSTLSLVYVFIFLFVLYLIFNFNRIIEYLSIFTLFFVLYTFIYNLFDYFEIKKKNESIIKDNNKILDTWKNNNIKNDHLFFDQYFIIEQLKQYLDEHLVTSTKEYPVL